MRQQQTVARSVACSGVGLHTGEPATLTLRPAPPDTGIVFILDDGHRPIMLNASVHNLVPTELCTALSMNGTSIKTVEHVLAALVGLEIDNAFVEIDAPEVPVLDGSAGPFVRLIKSAGIVQQERRQPFLKILRPITVADGLRRVVIEPASSTRVTYSIHFDHPLIRRQDYTFEWGVSSFEQEIADARTFGFLKEVEALWARGLGRGGTLENTIVLSEQGILNDSGLRFQDEFVRHKILDLIGDLALLGVPFIGHLIADRSGHALHTKLIEQILDRPDAWMLVDAADSPVAARPRSLRPVYAPEPALPLQVSPAF
jgi:UDP-3-O-[3-hydroxymyristoyl] N-acetylglucosamine deacetylase